MLRIDDLDTPRNMPRASDLIRRCLENFELYWDGEVYYQSQHIPSYLDALDTLKKAGHVFACHCSRKRLKGNHIYPGHCRDADFADGEQAALRIKTYQQTILFEDGIQGPVLENMALEHGDFIIRRRDQIIAYQFAVVIDDQAQDITHVVRGVDLLDSTCKQIHLQQLLGFSTPKYLHLPLIVDQQGHKLSKQTLAAPVDTRNPSTIIWKLLALLKQSPPTKLQNAPVTEQLQWAITHWQPQALQKIRAIQPVFD